MKISDLLEETYFSLTVNKIRTGLTMLGIVIGIGSVIAMISIGQGASSSIQSSIQSIGSNLILVMPGAQRGPGYQVSAGRGSAQTLTQEDAYAVIKEITSAKAVAPEISRRYQVISLIVGGIGIMNMMLTTVTERTREIGLRKAIGAKKKDISMQFLTESVALTFMGGFMGIIFGWLAAFGVTQFAGITTQVLLMSILMAFGVSATIGIVFGYYPARRAASLNPIEALRYE